MSCHCAEKVSLLIDGELPQSEVREVEHHLLGCVECQQLRADFLGLRQQLSSYPAAVDFATQQKALAAILGERTSQGSERPRWFGLQWNFGRAAVAFASLLLVALIVGVVTYRNVVLKKAPEHNASGGPGQQQKIQPAPQATQEYPRKNEEMAGVSQPRQLQKDNGASKSRVESNAINRGAVASAKRTSPVETQDVAIDEGPVRAADAVTMTAIHFEKSELLLRAFRNVRLDEPGEQAEVGYERKKAQQLVYQNMMLRREADTAGDVQTATLLENLEPILIDIANLPNKPADDDIRVIKERVERKNIVALLQVNSAALARGLD